MEAAAAGLSGYEPEMVTGLLQTEQYARAIMSTAPVPEDDDVERQIAVRMERQKRLTSNDPLSLWLVLNEAVIRRTVGGPKVMADQLRHLGELAARKKITIQVLPFTSGAHPAMHGGFKVIAFPEPVDPDVVYLEEQTGALYLEKQEDVRRYSLMFDHLRAQALSPEDSVVLVAQLAAQTA